MQIESVYDEAFVSYGRVVATVPKCLVAPVLDALEAKTPLPAATAYVASESALESLPEASELGRVLFGGKPVQLGWCNGCSRIPRAQRPLTAPTSG